MSLRLQRILWATFALTALVVVGIWAKRVTGKTIDEQRNLVPVSTVWGMHACVACILAGFVGSLHLLRSILTRRQVVTAVGVAVLGYAACGLAPQTSRIFFDEHIYMQIGQTIAHTGRAEGANYARAEYGKFEMYSPWTNKQPNGLPYLLSWCYRIAGVSDSVSHALNRIMVGTAAALIYLALLIVPWELPLGAPIAAAILFIATPLVLWWGHTVAVEPSASCTTVLGFFAACLHIRFRERETSQGFPATGILLAGATAFAVYFRPESVLVFAVCALVLWSNDDGFIEDISAWAALAMSAALAAPNFLHLWSMRTENWGATDGRRFDFAFVGKNLESNGGYFFNSHWFPLVGTIFAICGLLWLLFKRRSVALVLTVWFLASWGIFVLFYAGGYHYGASSRYGVVSCAPVAIFMGIGFAAVVRALRGRPVLGGFVAAAALVNWAAAAHYVPTLGREAMEAEADVKFVAKMAKVLPEGSLVLSPDPCMWQLQGINASQYFVLEQMVRNNLRELVNQYPGGVYAHWAFWHNAEPNMAHEAAKLIAEANGAEIARAQSQYHKLALFRLDTPEGLARFGGKPPVNQRPDTDLDRLLAQNREALRAPAAATSVPATP